MKRSVINKNIIWAKQMLEKHQISLPGFGYWDMEQWRENADQCAFIKKLMLGWDVTDYGLGRFDEIGGVLFTLRNGSVCDASLGTPYAEKYIILKKGQKLPMHMHKSKTEDIINRCGGAFSIKLYGCTADGELDESNDVTFKSDGMVCTVKAGTIVDIPNGASITLHPGLYHSFWAKDAPVIIGEVSSVNDDNTDNYFAEKVLRFSDIEEDEAPVHPLCNEYQRI